jgi:pyruvate kinase
VRLGRRRTKIVCTIGPATSTRGTVAALVSAGMDAARLNFSHGTHAEHAARARLVREAQESSGRPIALIADLQGPKLRVGELPEPRDLAAGDAVTVAGEGSERDGDLPVAPPVLSQVLRPGHDVMIDDGLVRLRVERVDAGRASCRVVVGGRVEGHKGVNLPGVAVPVPSLTEKDVRDLELALELDVDFVALSFVRSVEDVRRLRERLHAAGAQTNVIAKIEKGDALGDLSAIVEACDAVMVARGDLGVEIGPEEVPMWQKRIILSALEHGKPAITATQMLESMLIRPEPTRAEASDVANAILDGTAAVMLSSETAIGGFPVESVKAIDRIALAIEPSVGYRHELASTLEQPYPTVRDAISNAACDIAEVLSAEAILVPTFSGRTASGVARHRPRRPIVAVSHRRHALQQMAIEWGVVPCEIEEGRDVEHLWALTLEAAREYGIVSPGDRVVITAGTAINVAGTTNLIKVETA